MNVVTIVTILAAAAAWFDLRKGSIPNRLLFPGMAIGILFRITIDILEKRPSDILVMAAEVIVLFICLWPVYVTGGLGAGDCKLLLLAGVFLPVKQAVYVVINTFFAASAGIVLLVLFRGARGRKSEVKRIRFAPAFLIAVLSGWI